MNNGIKIQEVNNNNNNNNNNNGNFICVFECTIVNLAMYRQMLLEIGLFQKKKKKKERKKEKRKEKKRKEKSGLCQFPFLQQNM